MSVCFLFWLIAARRNSEMRTEGTNAYTSLYLVRHTHPLKMLLAFLGNPWGVAVATKKQI